MGTLPAYEPLLDAYHKAHRQALERIITELPITAGDHVLDMACGDGFYTSMLAHSATSTGRVTAVDISPAYLAQARRNHAEGQAAPVEYVQGKIERLPFPDNSFDMAWCAQSLFSFPDPVAALRELRRVVKSGGVAAVLEMDSMHQMILPWPPDLEIQIAQAELRAFAGMSDQPPKYYVGRRLRTVFTEAAFKPSRKRAYAHVWEYPLVAEQVEYLTAYLLDLYQRIAPHLSDSARSRVAELALPDSQDFMVQSPTFSATLLDFVMVGKK